ncbi:hypothetical protein [Aquisalinus flavus]|uniref:Uncharacterized protein n=1 Tax=Aquisalinus flavus TaxID=1526572 RepID=A0A8J2V2U8_9PROT|nr:hypothetical protein [Aquisalinus flavus]MBD0426474.1 hypothetical protein [Aquisalinus flavus]UNE47972.1 hypothetical protein FF099_07890 [Aquisalinus flavus]GGD07653.1 hypothetical protein GCM10011342_15620 [Aquisalinus flavus]
MTELKPERRSNRTHTWLIVLVVVAGLFAVSGLSLHHFGGGIVTVDGQTLHDLNPFEAIIAVIVGVLATIFAVLIAIIATIFGVLMGLIGAMIGILGAFFGIFVAILVVASPFLFIALIVWLIVKATGNGRSSRPGPRDLPPPDGA